MLLSVVKWESWKVCCLFFFPCLIFKKRKWIRLLFGNWHLPSQFEFLCFEMNWVSDQQIWVTLGFLDGTWSSKWPELTLEESLRGSKKAAPMGSGVSSGSTNRITCCSKCVHPCHLALSLPPPTVAFASSDIQRHLETSRTIVFIHKVEKRWRLVQIQSSEHPV